MKYEMQSSVQKWPWSLFSNFISEESDVQVNWQEKQSFAATLMEPSMWPQHQRCNHRLCQHSCWLASPLKCPAKFRVIASVHVLPNGHQHSARECRGRDPTTQTTPWFLTSGSAGFFPTRERIIHMLIQINGSEKIGPPSWMTVVWFGILWILSV